MLEANLAQMIVLVWEHVILQQEPAHAMLDAMGMIALLFVQMTALVWEHVLSQVTQYPLWYARIFSRCLMVSTNQADPSCFYFRIS